MVKRFFKNNRLELFWTIVVGFVFSSFYTLQYMKGLKIDYLQSIPPFTQPISLALYQGIFHLFGEFGIILFFQVLFPISCFYFLVKIFCKYLPKIWSISIATLAIFSSTNYPFRTFLIQIFSRNFSNLGSAVLPDIMGAASFSIMTFLILFYISTAHFKFPSRRLSGLTVLWSLLSFVSRIDALFGLIFWFTYFPIRLFRQHHNKSIKESAYDISLQIFIALVIVWPAIHSIETFSVSRYQHINLYYYAAYFLLPILATGIVYIIQKVDLYELIFKFWHIYMLMLIEALLIVASYFFAFGIKLDLLENRIPLFFLHFYYYVPILYYLLKPYMEYHSGYESLGVFQFLRKTAYLFFNRWHKTYLPVIILLIFCYSLFNSHKNYNNTLEIQQHYLRAHLNNEK